MLKDVHIIRFYGSRTDGEKQYLFLEYAAGGELFDKIGMTFCPSLEINGVLCRVGRLIHTLKNVCLFFN